MKDYSLNTEQQKAFKSLERALKKCDQLGIKVWDNYGVICAINGAVGCSINMSGDGEPLDESLVSEINVKCWAGSNADDQIYIE